MATAVQHGEEARNAEVVIERPDGSRITGPGQHPSAARQAAGPSRAPSIAFATFTPVKTLEEEHRRSSRDLEDFFENCPVGLHIVASDGTMCGPTRPSWRCWAIRPRTMSAGTSPSSMPTPW